MFNAKINFFLILSLVLLLGFSCDTGYDDSTRHRSQQTHDYGNKGNNKKNKKQTLQEKYQNNDFSSSLEDGGNRWIWQKPELVVGQIGPLEGKVVADIGAGPSGYFSLYIAYNEKVKKIIAMDIDKEAITYMSMLQQLLAKEIQPRFETRLVEPDDAKLAPEEVDVILIVNTVTYFEERVKYFRHLMDGMAPGGKLVIIDFKKKKTPVGPGISERLAIGDIEEELHAAGYKRVVSDDRTLEYQYIVTAYKNVN